MGAELEHLPAETLDPLVWVAAAGAGTVQDLAVWLRVWCQDATEIADRIRQLDEELGDLPSPELSQATVRAWLGVVALAEGAARLRGPFTRWGDRWAGDAARTAPARRHRC